MNEQEFKKKLKLQWFDDLKEGQEVLIKSKGTEGIHKIINKDMAFKTVMIDKGDGQFYWYPIAVIFPIPEHMNTELYKTLMECDLDD